MFCISSAVKSKSVNGEHYAIKSGISKNFKDYIDTLKLQTTNKTEQTTPNKRNGHLTQWYNI